MATDKVKATLSSVAEEAEGVKTFTFQPEGDYPFTAGQYAFLYFSQGGKRYAKHFTISNSPNRPGVSFTTIMSGSDYKNALDALPVGQAVELGKPMGEFTLDARKTGKVAFLAGGIGITPARSMIEHLMDTGNKEDVEYVVFYGNRTVDRIAFRDELGGIADDAGWLRMVHVISDDAPDGWGGETGFINQDMLVRHLKDLSAYTFYVAGPPGFNKAMREVLASQDQGMLIFESFAGYK